MQIILGLSWRSLQWNILKLLLTPFYHTVSHPPAEYGCWYRNYPWHYIEHPALKHANMKPLTSWAKKF